MIPSRVRRRLLATAVVGAGVAGVCALGLTADRLDGVQSRWEDALQPGLASSDDVVIVGIDRQTLDATAEWPWPRELHAELLDAIGAGRPAVVAYDVVFDTSRPGDDALADAMGRTPTVLAAALSLTVGSEGPPEIVDALAPTDDLAVAAVGVGHANITHSGRTGVVRNLPLYALDERGIARPSIAVVAVTVADGSSQTLTERPDGVQIGERFVPLDDAELWINWSETLAQGDVIPAIDVLSGSVDPAVFGDRVVVVGVTDPAQGDQHLVPTDRSGGTPGVVVIANATNTMLSSGYLSRPSTAAQVGLILVVSVGVAAMFMSLRLVFASAAALATAAFVTLFAAWRFHAVGDLWNLVWPVLAVILAAAVGTGWRYVAETRHRRRAWRLFSLYVPAEVVRQLEEPSRLAAAVIETRDEVTVVFCDIRGFTSLSGALEPARVRQLLDAFYGYVVAIIQRHGGTVIQFVGDEVFAVFGAPLAGPTAASDAVRCALALQDEIAALDHRLTTAGLPRARFGVGVHRGTVVAAHVGTDARRQYAVVGEAVNIGGRLCDLAEPGEILMSEQAWISADRSLGSVFAAAGSPVLKGVRVPVLVYRAQRAPAAAAGDDAAFVEAGSERTSGGKW